MSDTLKFADIQYVAFADIRYFNQYDFKRHYMREPGSDGNLNVMFFKKKSDNDFNRAYAVNRRFNFTWNLSENMTNRFTHIPDFAWISHALPLNRYRYPIFTKKAIYRLFRYIDYPICNP